MPAKKKTAKTAATKKTAAKKTAAKKTVAKKTVAKKSPKKAAPAQKTAPVADKKAPAEPAAVTPAPAKAPAGPVKMTAFVKKQQQKLLDLRDVLMEAMYGVQNEAIKAASSGSDNGSGQHQGDAGSDSYDRDLALSMLEKEKDSLMEVDRALERIAKGTYGICEVSGEKIVQERLEVLPFARLTMACQQALEAERLTRGVVQGDYGFGAFGESTRSVSLDGSDD